MRAQDRVLLVLADSVDFVALWYGAQKIGAVTAEAYTFLQPKDYAYYLEYTDAAVVVADETTQDVIRQVAGERRVLVVDDELQARLEQLPDELEPAPTTKDDIALWKFTTGSTGRPKGAVHPVHSACSATSGTRAACSGSARTTSCCPCRSSSSGTRAT